jgi:DNA-binding XRE family transcriptional regulator
MFYARAIAITKSLTKTEMARLLPVSKRSLNAMGRS